MEKLKHKLKDHGGFTLIEMLIVVAIIAILIAISIPVISATLERAREGVDQANERSAISLAYSYYMTHTNEDYSTGVEVYYLINPDSHEGLLIKPGTGVTINSAWAMYGQGRPGIGNVDEDNVDKYVKLTIKDPTKEDGSTPVVEAEWDDIV